MKQKGFICSCCGYGGLGEPFATDVTLPLVKFNHVFSMYHADLCEGCAIMISKHIELALTKIHAAPPEVLQ